MALGLIAAYCGFRVLIGIAVFVQLLRLPLRPVQVERVEAPTAALRGPGGGR